MRQGVLACCGICPRGLMPVLFGFGCTQEQALLIRFALGLYHSLTCVFAPRLYSLVLVGPKNKRLYVWCGDLCVCRFSLCVLSSCVSWNLRDHLVVVCLPACACLSALFLWRLRTSPRCNILLFIRSSAFSWCFSAHVDLFLQHALCEVFRYTQGCHSVIFGPLIVLILGCMGGFFWWSCRTAAQNFRGGFPGKKKTFVILVILLVHLFLRFLLFFPRVTTRNSNLLERKKSKSQNKKAFSRHQQNRKEKVKTKGRWHQATEEKHRNNNKGAGTPTRPPTARACGAQRAHR